MKATRPALRTLSSAAREAGCHPATAVKRAARGVPRAIRVGRSRYMIEANIQESLQAKRTSVATSAGLLER